MGFQHKWPLKVTSHLLCSITHNTDKSCCCHRCCMKCSICFDRVDSELTSLKAIWVNSCCDPSLPLVIAPGCENDHITWLGLTCADLMEKHAVMNYVRGGGGSLSSPHVN